MALHEEAAFDNETVVLDGNEYRNCTFTRLPDPVQCYEPR